MPNFQDVPTVIYEIVIDIYLLGGSWHARFLETFLDFFFWGGGIKSQFLNIFLTMFLIGSLIILQQIGILEI